MREIYTTCKVMGDYVMSEVETDAILVGDFAGKDSKMKDSETKALGMNPSVVRSPMTTLCYIEKEDAYLMLHRISKKNDVNKDKWIGIGGHFEQGESPEDCLLREAYEETGLTLTHWKFHGIVTFTQEGYGTEYMCLYRADGFTGELKDCDEGTLEWVPKKDLKKLNLWTGDLIFLDLMERDAPFFSLKLSYRGDTLVEAVLDGKHIEGY